MLKGQTIRHGSLAVFVRTVGFLMVVASVLAIVAALISLFLGHLTPRATVTTVVAAALCIMLAIVAERPFDPLRG